MGVARNTAGNYCLGKRTDGGVEEVVEVPKYILLACTAVERDLPPVN